MDADIASQQNQAGGSDCGCDGDKKPHGFRVSHPVFRAVPSQQHARERSDQQFGQQEGHIRECRVGSFLALGRNRCRILINARRIEGFPNGKEHDKERDHDVIGMHDANQAKIAMPKPVAEQAVRQRLEPDRRQRHDEYGRSADNAPEGHHPISGNPLRERANERNEANNQDAVDRPEPANGSAVPQYADAELRIDVIHLHQNQL